MNNGTCTFISVLCLRVNFENVWSVCHLPLLLPPPCLPPPPPPSVTPPPLPLAVYLAAAKCGACFDCPSLMPLIARLYQSHVTTGMPPPQQRLVVSRPAHLLWGHFAAGPTHWCLLVWAHLLCLWQTKLFFTFHDLGTTYLKACNVDLQAARFTIVFSR